MEAARDLGAPVVELHTGSYCEAAVAGDEAALAHELERIRRAAAHGAGSGWKSMRAMGSPLKAWGPWRPFPRSVS